VLSQDERVVQVHSRSGDLWRERFVSSGRVELDEPPVELVVDMLDAASEIAA